MLRRYQRLSVELGRLPSLLGREFFRTRVTSYRDWTFEERVIFVHEVASGLAQLGGFEHKLIAKIALQDYTQNETARLLGCCRRAVGGASRKRWTGLRKSFWKLVAKHVPFPATALLFWI
jgi:hypothetical protein